MREVILRSDIAIPLDAANVMVARDYPAAAQDLIPAKARAVKIAIKCYGMTRAALFVAQQSKSKSKSRRDLDDCKIGESLSQIKSHSRDCIVKDRHGANPDREICFGPVRFGPGNPGRTCPVALLPCLPTPPLSTEEFHHRRVSRLGFPILLLKVHTHHFPLLLLQPSPLQRSFSPVSPHARSRLISHSQRLRPENQAFGTAPTAFSLLSSKQECGLSSLTVVFRFSVSLRNGTSDVDSIPIVQTRPDGHSRAASRLTATHRLNCVYQLIRLLYCVKLLRAEPDKHGLFECIDTG